MNEYKGELELIVGAPPDRIDISVEIYAGDIQLAEVCDDPGYPVVEFYQLCNPPFAVRTEVLMDAIRRATEILAKRPRKSSE
jgi:hypothetical protein